MLLRPPLGLRAALFLALVSTASGCAPGAPAPSGTRVDLLVRHPDRVLEEPGVLTPTGERVWGDYTAPGWGKATLFRDDGTPYLETNQPSASLRLPATHAAARTLLLTLWSPGAEAPRKAEIRLDDRLLATVEVTGTPSEVEVPTPAELWRVGDNALQLSSPAEDGGTWHPLALSRVEYGTERRPEFDAAAARWSLPSETGLSFVVEPLADPRLELESSAARGTLSIRAGSMDPATGAGSLRPLFTKPGGGAVTDLRLPRVADQLLQVELSWSSPSGDALQLSRLAVVDQREVHPRPSVLLISIDTWAARHMSLYGYRRSTTPNLEELANDAVVFERCVANAPWTMPSYLSVMTGLYPSSHLVALERAPGLHFDNWDYWQVADSRWTLAEAMRARGYQTAASIDTLWLTPKFKIDQGFDLYDMEAAGYGLDDRYHGIVFIAERFGHWLDELRRPEAPFFAFIHALDSHGPYWPDGDYLDAFEGDLPDDLRPTPAGSAHLTYKAIPMWMARTLAVDKTDAHPPIPERQPLEEIIARYDEAIRETDAYVGRILDELRERGLYDDCVVVVTGDHGESFDHLTYGHGNLWEDIVQVPLLIKLPHGEHGGIRFDQSVQLVDLYPTLMDLVGAHASRAHLHGRSLLAAIEGETSAPRPTFCEGGHIEQYMVEDGGWKLTELWPGTGGDPSLLTHPRVPREWLEKSFPELARTGILTYELWERMQARPDYAAKLAELRELVKGPYYELYDLNADPHELHDLAGEREDVVARLKGLLRERKEATRAARANASSAISLEPLSDEALKALSDLGYGGEKGR